MTGRRIPARLKRLYAEAIPFRPDSPPATGAWTSQEQDRHWHALCQAVGATNERRPNQPA